MPFIAINSVSFTDLVLKEDTDLDNYFSRDRITVTTDTGTGVYPFGTPVTRVKALDDSGAWVVVNAGADILLDNEYALLIGDGFEVNTNGVSLVNGVAKNVNAITRRARVKEGFLRSLPLIAALSANEFRDLKGLLRKNAGIRVEDTNPTI